jgi:hypothetical protein
MKTNYWKSIAGLGLLALSLGVTSCNSPWFTPQSKASEPKTQPSAKVEESQDEKFTKKIIGTWEMRRIEDESVVVAQESFYPSQQFNGTANAVNKDGKTIYIRYSGTWKIENGYLYYKVTSSSKTDLMPVGDLNANKIVNITDKDYVYIDPQGRQQVDRRVS